MVNGGAGPVIVAGVAPTGVVPAPAFRDD